METPDPIRQPKSIAAENDYREREKFFCFPSTLLNMHLTLLQGACNLVPYNSRNTLSLHFESLKTKSNV